MKQEQIKELAQRMVMEVRALNMETCTGEYVKGWPKPATLEEEEKTLENHRETRKKYHIFLKQLGVSTREFDLMMKVEYDKPIEVDGEEQAPCQGQG